VNIKKVTTKFDKNKVQNKDSNCAGGRFAEDLVMGEYAYYIDTDGRTLGLKFFSKPL